MDEEEYGGCDDNGTIDGSDDGGDDVGVGPSGLALGSWDHDVPIHLGFIPIDV